MLKLWWEINKKAWVYQTSELGLCYDAKSLIDSGLQSVDILSV